MPKRKISLIQPHISADKVTSFSIIMSWYGTTDIPFHDKVFYVKDVTPCNTSNSCIIIDNLSREDLTNMVRYSLPDEGKFKEHIFYKNANNTQKATKNAIKTLQGYFRRLFLLILKMNAEAWTIGCEVKYFKSLAHLADLSE